jgi:hypothetical protein
MIVMSMTVAMIMIAAASVGMIVMLAFYFAGF